jgi:signal transduction histidine kinase
MVQINFNNFKERIWEDRSVMSEVLQASPIPQFVIDREHRVVFWNRALEQYSGIMARDVVGTRDQWKAFYPEKRPVLADLLVEGAVDQLSRWYGGKYSSSRLVEDAYEATDFFPHLGKEGTWLYFTAAPIRGPVGEIIGALETLEDVTERKKAEQALMSARDQAELYLELIGHDINNLNQVGIGYLEIALARLQLSDSDRELLARPLEVLLDSSRLIANIQKLQVVKAGKAGLEPVDMGRVLAEVIDDYRIVPGRAVSISYSYVPGLTVMANELLRDVFSNIIGNAIKHSLGPLAIEVAVGVLQRDGRSYYEVSVGDTGPGIPDDAKPGLFTRFGGGRTRARGRGLGLYLVKTLVGSYGGDVRVEDRVPGEHTKGAKFVVTLPAAGE